MGASWRLLGVSWRPLEPSERFLKASWKPWKTFQGLFKSSWRPCRAKIAPDRPWASKILKNTRKNKVFGSPAGGILDVLEALGGVLESLEGVLEASWRVLEAS